MYSLKARSSRQVTSYSVMVSGNFQLRHPIYPEPARPLPSSFLSLFSVRPSVRPSFCWGAQLGGRSAKSSVWEKELGGRLAGWLCAHSKTDQGRHTQNHLAPPSYTSYSEPVGSIQRLIAIFQFLCPSKYLIPTLARK